MGVTIYVISDEGYSHTNNLALVAPLDNKYT